MHVRQALYHSAEPHCYTYYLRKKVCVYMCRSGANIGYLPGLLSSLLIEAEPLAEPRAH